LHFANAGYWNNLSTSSAFIQSHRDVYDSVSSPISAVNTYTAKVCKSAIQAAKPTTRQSNKLLPHIVFIIQRGLFLCSVQARHPAGVTYNKPGRSSRDGQKSRGKIVSCTLKQGEKE